MSLNADGNKIQPRAFCCVLHRNKRLRLFKYSEKLFNGTTKHFEPNDNFLSDISSLHVIGNLRFRLAIGPNSKLLNEIPIRFHKLKSDVSLKLHQEYTN